MRILGYRLANDEAVTIADGDWLQHVYAIGATGSGKTTWLESLMAADLSQRRGFCYIDKHGDSAKRMADSSPQPIIYWRPADLALSVSINPLQGVEPDRAWKVVADLVSLFSGIWNLGEHTPQLLYYLRASLHLLISAYGGMEGTHFDPTYLYPTLLDIRRVLSNAAYRRRLYPFCDDEQTMQTWQEFEAKAPKDQTSEVRSLQNKLAALADALPLRYVIGRPFSTISIRKIIDSGTVLVVDLSGIGEEPARLLGALLVSQFAQAAEARSEIEEADRRDYTLYVDEFQNFASLAFAKILSEARKWHLSVVLAHQYIDQITEIGLHEAVLGNCGTLVSFRVGVEDAPLLARALGAPESELAALSRGKAFVRTLRDGQPTVARPMAVEKAKLATGHLAAAIANTRANFSRPSDLANRRRTRQRGDWH